MSQGVWGLRAWKTPAVSLYPRTLRLHHALGLPQPAVIVMQPVYDDLILRARKAVVFLKQCGLDHSAEIVDEMVDAVNELTGRVSLLIALNVSLQTGQDNEAGHGQLGEPGPFPNPES